MNNEQNQLDNFRKEATLKVEQLKEATSKKQEVLQNKLFKIGIELKNISKAAKRFVFLLAGMENTEIILLKGETKSFDVIKKGKKAGTITLTRA